MNNSIKINRVLYVKWNKTISVSYHVRPQYRTTTGSVSQTKERDLAKSLPAFTAIREQAKLITETAQTNGPVDNFKLFDCVNDTLPSPFRRLQSPEPGTILTDSISLSVADMSPIFVSHVIKPSSVDSLRRCCKGVRAHMYPRRGHGVEVSMTPPL